MWLQASAQQNWNMGVVMVQASSSLLAVTPVPTILELALFGVDQLSSRSHPTCFRLAQQLHPDVAPILIFERDAFQSLISDFLPRVPMKFSKLFFFRWHVVQRFRFPDPIFQRNGTLVSHWSLPNRDAIIGTAVCSNITLSPKDN